MHVNILDLCVYIMYSCVCMYVCVRVQCICTCTGCISKNLTLNKKLIEKKLTFGKWSSLLIYQRQLSLDQNKVKNENILKGIIKEF